MNPSTGEIQEFNSKAEADAAGFTVPVEKQPDGTYLPRRQRRRFVQRPARFLPADFERMQANREAEKARKKAKAKATAKMKARARARG